MSKMPDRDEKFESLLREGAQPARRSAPDGLATRVMVEVRRADRVVAGVIGWRAWRRSALAAALAMAAALLAATLLLREAPVSTQEGQPVAGIGPDIDSLYAEPGPMAMLASLQRVPEDLGSALHDAMMREMGLLLEEAWREPQHLLARLPTRGRIDREGGELQ